MIIMIKPTENDIGTKRVVYKQDWMTSKDWEYGVITGFNEYYVFVRYGSETQSKATKRENLYWDVQPIIPKDDGSIKDDIQTVFRHPLKDNEDNT